jgi:hypothetical protein
MRSRRRSCKGMAPTADCTADYSGDTAGDTAGDSAGSRGSSANRSMGRWRAGLIALCVIGPSVLTGCGYSTRRPFPTDITTVHVEMFHSKEFRRELEFRLTESIIKRIEMDTPYRIGPRGTADAVLTGEIIRVENRTLGESFDTDLPREIGSTVEVRYLFKDLRSGEILVDRPRFVYQASYIPPVGETFTQGMTRAFDGLAEQIVETMESGW